MNKFSWYEAKSIEDALGQVSSTVSDEIIKQTGKSAVIKAGGTDLLDLVKEGIVQPQKIVNIRNLPGLNQVTFDQQSGLRLGANTTLSEIESNNIVSERYHALYEAVSHAATPQIRNMATLGGNLMQRTRCWYFRSADHDCLRKGGGRCFARKGENENHAIMNNGGCVSIHASSVSTALVAYDAFVEVVNQDNEARQIPIEEFFVSPGEDPTTETVLKSNELITAVILPTPSSRTKSFYVKQGVRESYDWSLADVALVAEMNGNKITKARIVLGAAAPTPLRSRDAERYLVGKQANNESAAGTARAAIQRARPLSKNAYKIPLFEALVKQAVLEMS